MWISYFFSVSKTLPLHQTAFLKSIKETMASVSKNTCIVIILTRCNIFLLQGFSLKKRGESDDELKDVTEILMKILLHTEEDSAPKTLSNVNKLPSGISSGINKNKNPPPSSSATPKTAAHLPGTLFQWNKRSINNFINH